MPLRMEGARVSLGSSSISSGRRSRGLADIAPQYVNTSGLCDASDVEGGRGTSYRIQLVQGPEGGSRFPKLDECAHFHYEHVDLGPIQVKLLDEDDVKPLSQDRDSGKYWYLSVTSHGKTWMVRRSYDNFRMLDQQLHRCIYDRKFSGLMELPLETEGNEAILSGYLSGLSKIAGSFINCGPVLNWLEMDNRGRRLLVPDTDTCPINTPAVAAAYAIKRYQAQAPDELSFEVGDMISVIDMPPPEESIWWRGKKEYMVGFFPSECVSVIGEKVPRNLKLNSSNMEPSKSVLRKHGKLIAFFRSFILSRPSRRRLKQSGILKERVFGCDLGEHLQNSGYDIPVVLKCCAEFIETHGIVDGIYRLSGINSNIIKLRNAFDEDRVPALYEDLAIRQDIHSVASLVKMYFRELPNPLCTYQLYQQFVIAVQDSAGEDMRLLRLREVVHKLPPPHYRTLEYLIKHLAKVALRGPETGMTARNVAIVWAPNLLRSREFEVGGVAALQSVGVQAVVTEFLVTYVDLIFTDTVPAVSLPDDPLGSCRKSRPKSLAISTPTKLLPLEEAQNRIFLKGDQEYIEVGGGPASLPPQYHTVIDLPRKRPGSKRSPLGWRKFFSGRGSKGAGSGHQRKSSTPADLGREKTVSEDEAQSIKRRIRPAKSVESLNSAGETPVEQAPSQMISSPKLLRPVDKSANHNRSVSHESYFDTLQDQGEDEVFESPLDISEIQMNFDLEESEMRIFSEDETLAGSGSISFSSPRPNKLSKSLPMSKRLTNVKLARGDDSLSSSHSADPSPKKQKTQETEVCERSRLEERLSTSAGELQFIDSVSPDQIWIQAEVHPIQSPSPVSCISQVSSLVPRTSPILPHIPHLQPTREQQTDVSDTETISLQSSTLTTPDTPLAAVYAPLIESPDPPRPEERKQRPYHPYENVGSLVKPNVVLETSFDVLEPVTPVQTNRDSVGSVKYELISTESSCDSLIDMKRTDESRNLLSLQRGCELMDQSPAESKQGDSVEHLIGVIPIKMDERCELRTLYEKAAEDCIENEVSSSVSLDTDTGINERCSGAPENERPASGEYETLAARDLASELDYVINRSPLQELLAMGHLECNGNGNKELNEKEESPVAVPKILGELSSFESQYCDKKHSESDDKNYFRPDTDAKSNNLLQQVVLGEESVFLVDWPVENQPTYCTTEVSNKETDVFVPVMMEEVIGESVGVPHGGLNEMHFSEMIQECHKIVHPEDTKMEVSGEDLKVSEGGDQPGLIKLVPLDLNAAEDSMILMDVSEKDQKLASPDNLVSSEENLSGLASMFQSTNQLESNASTESSRSSGSSSDTDESSETQITEISSQQELTRIEVRENIGAKISVVAMKNTNIITKEDIREVGEDENVSRLPASKIVKPPRKVFREVQKTDDRTSWNINKGFMEIATLEKSPILRNHRRFSLDDQNKPSDKSRTSVIASAENRGRWSSRGPQEVIRVTARLSESLPVSLAKTSSSGSPRRVNVTVENEPDWTVETPQRSSSSGNVRQLLHKFEGCDRPRTLERLSTRRARESAELDLTDPERRERIEKYKEKRRTYLREKYRAELEAARRVAPFEKPPRKNLPPATSSSASVGGRRSYETGSGTTNIRRSFESPTVSSTCRSSLTRANLTDRRSGGAPKSPDEILPLEKQHHSLDFVLNDSRELPKSPERKPLSSPRRKASTPEATSPPYCIKEMAAKFEKRDRQSSQKQYLSSV